MAYNQGQQPPAAPVTNVVVTTQPQQNKLLLVSFEGQRNWSTGLFDCFDDIQGCLCTVICPGCMESRIASRTKESCYVSCCIPGGTVALRTKIRLAGGISGSLCNDCLTMSLCGQCALCQMARELDNMGVP